MSSRREPQKLPGVAFGFFIGLGLIIGGVALVWSLFWVPYRRTQRAKNWTPTTCRIVSARIAVNTDSDGDDSFSIDLAYAYDAKGRSLLGHRYSFFDDLYSRQQTITDLVKTLRNARVVPCYFDPSDVRSSVINRSFHRASLAILGGLAIAVVGLGLLLSGFRRRRKALRKLGGAARWKRSKRNGRVTLVRRNDRFWEIFSAASIAIAFGPVAFGLGSVYGQGSSWGVVGVLFLYAIAGAGVLWLVYEALAIVGPRFRLTVQHLDVRPGAQVELEWQARGWFPSFRTLTFSLVGREEVRYTDAEGDQASEVSEFYADELKVVSEPTSVRYRKLVVPLPDTAMHTFASEHNEVYWCVRVVADVRLWPDVDAEFDLNVLPAMGMHE